MELMASHQERFVLVMRQADHCALGRAELERYGARIMS